MLQGLATQHTVVDGLSAAGRGLGQAGRPLGTPLAALARHSYVEALQGSPSTLLS